jgi:hypothetical protein
MYMRFDGGIVYTKNNVYCPNSKSGRRDKSERCDALTYVEVSKFVDKGKP